MSGRNQYSTPTADLIAQATVDLSRAAGTYDLFTASNGDVLIWSASLYCTVVGATFTSCAIQTNSTTNFVILNTTDGAVANFTAGKNMTITWAQVQKILVRSGSKVQYTMAGTTGSGTAILTLNYYSINGSDLV